MYNRKIYNEAVSILAAKKAEAESKREMRHSECLVKFPEIADLERKMAMIALDIGKSLGMGLDAKPFIETLAKENLSCQTRIKEILSEAKIPQNYLDVKYACEKCKDTGFSDGKMCTCLKELMKNIAYKEMCDAFPLDNCTFEKLNLCYYPQEIDDEIGVSSREHMREITEFCENYAEDFSAHSGNLLMYGETGLGKTHLSLAIVGKVLEKGYGVIYGSAQNLLGSLENEKFGRTTDKISVEQSILNCDLLIMDDLGAEFSTPFTLSAIYNIINSRLLSRKAVIINTNLSVEELERKYSKRVASRIIGNYTYLIFSGKDVRQIKNGY
ncbi:Chromosomal replication initiator protein DnaA [bioreactor metagenome]|uniref:Chromosomal replication initiator protein DnaA n=1 Tax=bioreactor metagenome TaxID=1076179 RepID=A0A645CDT5_9ZZZZ